MNDEKLFLTLKEIDKKLKGINWILISGLAVKLYAYPERKSDDIDILIPNEEDFVKASKIFNKEIRDRFLEKGTFSSKDKGFETVVNGVNVEVTRGLWHMKFKEFEATPKIDEEWLKHVQKREFHGIKLKLQPLEEVIIIKVFMGREKDEKDLEKLLKLNIDKNFLERNAKNWNCYDKLLEFLKKY